jgi:2-aminoethylphosphonate transport system permease protein
MLLWSPQSRAAILVVFAVVVLVVFVAPLATVVIAGLAGSWTEALPSDLGLGHFDDALSGENLASLSVSLQTALSPAAWRWCSVPGPHWPRGKLRSG